VAGTRMTEELLGPFSEYLDPAQVTPMVVYLCSEQNTYTHEIFSAGGGRYARFFIGVNQGWFAGSKAVPTVEELADHLEQVRDISTYQVMGSSTEEIQLIGSMISGGA
jgi:hypothetical protein